MLQRSDLRRRPVRIVHVTQCVAGGIASFFEEVAEYQSARFGKTNVTFVVPDGAEHLPRLDPGQMVCFRSAARSPSALTHFAGTAYRAIRRLQPDIVHLHSSFAGAILRPLLRFGRKRPRVIYCPHGWSFAMDTTAARQKAYALVERRLAAITDLILVNSQSEYDLATSFGLPRGKMRSVPNGIAWAAAPPQRSSEGPIRLVFIGRHDRQKGVDILLDAISRFPLPDLHFDIVGDTVLSIGGATTRPADANVTFHGWLSRSDTLELLNRAEAVVMPSRWDAGPIVASEAMRARVPVIGSNRGAIPEIVQHGVGGYIFDLDDPSALGRVLQSLDRDELKRLGIAARARWERYYVSDRMNELTCQAYDDVLPARKSGIVDHANATTAASAVGGVSR